MSGKWNVGILIFDGVEVLDFAGPFEVFSRTRLAPGPDSRRSEETAPFHVFTVARLAAPVTATGGLVVTPRHSFADAPRIGASGRLHSPLDLGPFALGRFWLDQLLKHLVL